MGAHDANFHGDQLRLSVFLRIIGDGVSPRPVRRNRRAVIAKPGNQTSKESFDMSSSKHSRSPASPIADLHMPLPGAGDEGTQETCCFASVSGRSPSPSPETPIAYIQAGATKTPTRNQVSSYARKGELYVNELALLRTTSSHGLPHPSVRLVDFETCGAAAGG
jgi:hypothetical protein